MELTRRKVLTLGALTAASAAVPLSAFAGIMGAGAPATTAGDNEYDNLARLTVADFKPWVGSVFDVATGESQSTLLILDEVQDPPSFPKPSKKTGEGKNTAASSTTNAPKIKSFALRFKEVSGDPLDQGTYVSRMAC